MPPASVSKICTDYRILLLPVGVPHHLHITRRFYKGVYFRRSKLSAPHAMRKPPISPIGYNFNQPINLAFPNRASSFADDEATAKLQLSS